LAKVVKQLADTRTCENGTLAKPVKKVAVGEGVDVGECGQSDGLSQLFTLFT
jgi:hypothetical protein